KALGKHITIEGFQLLPDRIAFRADALSSTVLFVKPAGERPVARHFTIRIGKVPRVARIKPNVQPNIVSVQPAIYSVDVFLKPGIEQGLDWWRLEKILPQFQLFLPETGRPETKG